MKKQTIHKELHAAIQCLDDKKATELTVLDMQDNNSVARYFVIATATSSTHLTALKNALMDHWKKNFSRILHSESRPGSSWQVIDIDDVMVHLFTPEERSRYNLEGLWGDSIIRLEAIEG
jgi:ribosome-associated protein